jgi:hypothetical protein
VPPLHLQNDLISRTAEDIEGTYHWKGRIDSRMPDSDNESDCVVIDFRSYVLDEFVNTAALCFF